jgi:stage II sporulation protein D
VLTRSRLRSAVVVTALALFGLFIGPVLPADAAAKVPTKFVIAGSGAGHGAGMSQYGAYQLARTGSSAEQILGHFYPGTSVDWANNNPRTVKVQVLGPPSDNRKSATITVKGGRFTVADTAGRAVTSAKAGKVRVTVTGAKVRATVGKKSLTGARLKLTTTGVATVTGAQGSYHYGNLQVTVISKRLNVVNEVAMNTEYLYGLDEMPASWGSAGARGKEALKAQAIAARTFVIGQLTNHLNAIQREPGAGMASCDCHVFDDERSQNYTGWKKAGAKANAAWVAAVKSTIQPDSTKPNGSGAQVVHSASGQIAEMPYFASTGITAGARTGANADVFGTAQLTYLRSVPDPYSAQAPGNPYRSWTRKVSQATVAKIFSLKKITRIVISGTYSGGLVKSLTATSTDGRSVTLTKTSNGWMDALGVPSPWLSSLKPG